MTDKERWPHYLPYTTLSHVFGEGFSTPDIKFPPEILVGQRKLYKHQRMSPATCRRKFCYNSDVEYSTITLQLKAMID